MNSLATIWGRKMKDYEKTYQCLHQIYRKYLPMYPENPDSKQICCMWSIHAPPDVIEGTDPFVEIEEAFDIYFDEDMAWKLYEMDLADATRMICAMVKVGG